MLDDFGRPTTDAEWGATTELLVGTQQWSELWRLAQEAPPIWSIRLLRRLSSQRLSRTAPNWCPPEKADTSSFDQLLQLAGDCCDEQPFHDELEFSQLAVHRSRLDLDLTCLAMTVDSRIVVGASGGRLHFLNSSDGRLIRNTAASHHVNCLAMSPNGKILASAGYGKSISLRTLPDARVVTRLKGHAQEVSGLAISPDSQSLVSIGCGTIQIWDLPTGQPVRTLNVKTGTCAALSPDWRILASASEGRQTIQLSCLTDGRLLQRLRGHKAGVSCLAITPDGQILVSGSLDKTIRFWSLPEGRLLTTLEGHKKKINCLAVTSDGKFLVSGSDDTTHYDRSDHEIHFWRISDGGLLQTLEGHTGPVTSIAVSPDGRVLASNTGGEDSVRLWSIGKSTSAIRVVEAPLANMSDKELHWAQRKLQDSYLSSNERNWLKFIVAMLLWRRRFDVQIGEMPPNRPTVGGYDIEIDG